MNRRSGVLVTTLAMLSLLPMTARGQDAPAREALRVYLDCQGLRCDFDFFRREITWVNWVRTRDDAEVHVLVTSRSTGSGGREYTLSYLGEGAFAGSDRRLVTATPQTATDDDRRRELARTLRVGLAGYAAAKGLGSRLDVVYQPLPGEADGEVQRPHDPWNFWVFRISADGNFNGESRSSASNLRTSVRASRITDDWKLSLSARANRRTNDYTFEDSTSYHSITSSSGADAQVVRSLGEHWAFGVQGSFDQSDRDNLDAQFRFAPGIEYDIWPYRESSRRQLTVLYELGVNSFNYQDSTIFDLVKETRLDQRVTIALSAREPWGNTYVSVRGANYLSDFAQNEFSIYGGINLRIYKGLSVDVNASYSRVRNQLNIAKEGASDEEVLLQLRALQTGYRYGVSVGLSFTFGSIYNNIVNPRFSGGRGGGGGGGGGNFFF